jgi:hypothetical protein
LVFVIDRVSAGQPAVEVNIRASRGTEGPEELRSRFAADRTCARTHR